MPDTGLVAPAQHVLDLDGADPVSVVRVDVAHLPGPAPVAVTHHADVVRTWLAGQRGEEPALVHRIDQIPHVSAHYPSARRSAGRDRRIDPTASHATRRAPGHPDTPPASARTAGMERRHRGHSAPSRALSASSSAQSTPGSLSPNFSNHSLICGISACHSSRVDRAARRPGPRLGHVEPVDVQRLRRRHVADRGLDGGGGALDPLDDPLEHPASSRRSRATGSGRRRRGGTS